MVSWRCYVLQASSAGPPGEHGLWWFCSVFILAFQLYVCLKWLENFPFRFSIEVVCWKVQLYEELSEAGVENRQLRDAWFASHGAYSRTQKKWFRKGLLCSHFQVSFVLFLVNYGWWFRYIRFCKSRCMLIWACHVGLRFNQDNQLFWHETSSSLYIFCSVSKWPDKEKCNARETFFSADLLCCSFWLYLELNRAIPRLHACNSHVIESAEARVDPPRRKSHVVNTVWAMAFTSPTQAALWMF